MRLQKTLNMNEQLISAICDRQEILRLGDDFAIIEKADVRQIKGIVIRSECYIILQCLEGCLNLTVNMADMTIEAGQVVYLMRDQMYEINDVSDTFNAKVLLLSEQFIQWLDLKRYYFFMKNSGKPIQSTSYGSFEQFLGICRNVITLDKNPEKRKVIQLLTEAYLLSISHFAILTEGKGQPLYASERIMKKFMSMLSTTKGFHRSPEYYAEIIGISAKHLSFASRQCTGHGALHWINRATTLEAKSLLSSSDLKMQEIAKKLNFSNQSVFGRFFKQNTGVSPMKYRKDFRI